jgi:hypothetical protein
MQDHSGQTGPAAQRRAWGRRGELLVHGNGRTNVKAAHEALRLHWERMADPDGTLPPDVRAKRAAMLRRAHMISLSLAAAEARRRKSRRRPPEAA